MMIIGSAQKNKGVISSLMATQLQRLWKGLATAIILSFIPFLLHPQFEDYLIPYETQLYLNLYYRYGVWIIFFGLVLYCLHDVYFYRANTRILTPYQQFPVSSLKQQVSWIFSVNCIFSLYFMWQILLFVLFYQICMLKEPDLAMVNGLYFSAFNAIYAKLYLPVTIGEGVLWMIRMFVYAFITVFFGRGIRMLRKHWIFSILFAFLLFCYVGIWFVPMQVLILLPSTILQHLNWIVYSLQFYYYFMYCCEVIMLLCSALFIFRAYRKEKGIKYGEIS